MSARVPVYGKDELNMMIETIKRNMTNSEHAMVCLNSSGFSDFFTLPALFNGERPQPIYLLQDRPYPTDTWGSPDQDHSNGNGEVNHKSKQP